MNPDNTKLSDCHNYVTDSTDPNAIKCCACGQVCTWHPPENPSEQKPPEPTQTTPEDVKTQPEPPQGQKDEEIRTDSDFKPILQKKFEMYKVWKSAAPIFKVQSDESLMNAGFDDWQIELMRIKTQKEFAENFEVDQDTLTLWNEKLPSNSEPPDWAKDMNSNVIASLYRGILKKGDADKVKIWLQYVIGWVPKTETKIEDSRETTKLRNKLSDIMEKWSDDETDKGNGDGSVADDTPAQQ